MLIKLFCHFGFYLKSYKIFAPDGHKMGKIHNFTKKNKELL